MESVLDIRDTQLGGAIPSELGNINLTELHFSDNELSGEIPSWLGNHSELIGLSLGGNQLSGRYQPSGEPSTDWKGCTSTGTS